MNATTTKTTTETKQRKAARALAGQRKRTLRLDHVRELARALFGEVDMHAKRVESLANGVAGALNAAMFTIHGIGQPHRTEEPWGASANPSQARAMSV